MTYRLFLLKDKANYFKFSKSNSHNYSSLKNDLLESRRLNPKLNLYTNLKYFDLNSNKYINNNSFNNINLSSSLNLNKFLKTHNNNCNNKTFYTIKPSPYILPKDLNIKEIFYSLLKKANKLQNNKISIYSTENKIRRYVLEKLKIFLFKNNISFNIFYRTIFLYDLMQMKNNMYKYFASPNIHEKLALIALILTMKFNYEETKMVHLKKFEKIFDDFWQTETFSTNSICQMEILALKLIDYDLNFTTPFCFLELMLVSGIIINTDNLNNELNLNIYKLVNDTMKNIIENSNEYFKYNYFYLACSVVSFIREKFNLNKWPKNLENAFSVNFDQFYYVFRNFFGTDNNKNYNHNSCNNIYDYENIINIQNLQNMNNIVNVMRIMTSKEKDNNKKIKNDENKNYLTEENNTEKNNAISKNNEILGLENNNPCRQIKVELKTNWDLTAIKSPVKNKKIMVNKSAMINSIDEKFFDKKNVITNENESKEKNIVNNLNNTETKTKRNIYNKKNSNNITLTSIFDKSNQNIISKNETDNKYLSTNSNINKSSNKSNNTNKLNLSLHKFKRNTYYSRKRLINNFQNEQNKNEIIENDKIEENTSSNNNIKTENNVSHKNENLNYSASKGREYRINFHFAINTSKNSNSNNNKNVNSNEKSPTKNNYFNSYHDVKHTNHKNYIIYSSEKKKLGNGFILDTVKISNFLDKSNKNIKVKEENSNEATCEDSKQAKDVSIRKTYCLKKRKFFERNNDVKDLKTDDNNNENIMIEKNKSYGKLIDNKIKLSHNTFNRMTGVRKFYKQKNMCSKH